MSYDEGPRLPSALKKEPSFKQSKPISEGWASPEKLLSRLRQSFSSDNLRAGGSPSSSPAKSSILADAVEASEQQQDPDRASPVPGRGVSPSPARGASPSLMRGGSPSLMRGGTASPLNRSMSASELVLPLGIQMADESQSHTATGFGLDSASVQMRPRGPSAGSAASRYSIAVAPEALPYSAAEWELSMALSEAAQAIGSAEASDSLPPELPPDIAEEHLRRLARRTWLANEEAITVQLVSTSSTRNNSIDGGTRSGGASPARKVSVDGDPSAAMDAHEALTPTRNVMRSGSRSSTRSLSPINVFRRRSQTVDELRASSPSFANSSLLGSSGGSGGSGGSQYLQHTEPFPTSPLSPVTPSPTAEEGGVTPSQSVDDEWNEAPVRTVPVDETTTAESIVEAVLAQHGVDASAADYVLVAVDEEGNETVFGRADQPAKDLATIATRKMSFRLRKRRVSYSERMGSMTSMTQFGSSMSLHAPTQPSFARGIVGNDAYSKILAETMDSVQELVNEAKTHLDTAEGDTALQTAHYYRELHRNLVSSLEHTLSVAADQYKRLITYVDKETPLVIEIKSFRVEAPPSGVVLPPHMEPGAPLRPASEIKYIDDNEPVLHHASNSFVYREYFWDRSKALRLLQGQLNFLGHDSKLGPLCVSVIKERGEKGDTSGNGRYRVLIWTREGCYVRFMPSQSAGYLRGEVLAELISLKFSTDHCLTWVTNEEVCRALLKMEADQAELTYKFGVLYVKDGQIREEDMFGNQETSPAYEEFLALLGERVRLKGWKKFRAGLDVENDTTGTHSIYTQWRGLEIMFHVSTMLPFDDQANSQQVARKRHIGNDICLILFVDGNTPYFPDTVASRFNHVFAVVRPNPDSTYSLAVACKDSVPEFGPPILYSKYDRSPAFIDLLLCKLVNGQNAAYRAPVFREKMRRTREFLLNDLVEKYRTPSVTAAGRRASTNAAPDGTPRKDRYARLLRLPIGRGGGNSGSSSEKSEVGGGASAPELSLSNNGSNLSGVGNSAASSSTSSGSSSGFTNTLRKHLSNFGPRRATMDAAHLRAMRPVKAKEPFAD